MLSEGMQKVVEAKGELESAKSELDTIRTNNEELTRALGRLAELSYELEKRNKVVVKEHLAASDVEHAGFAAIDEARTILGNSIDTETSESLTAYAASIRAADALMGELGKEGARIGSILLYYSHGKLTLFGQEMEALAYFLDVPSAEPITTTEAYIGNAITAATTLIQGVGR